MQGGGADLSGLEKEFVKVAKSYSAEKGHLLRRVARVRRLARGPEEGRHHAGALDPDGLAHLPHHGLVDRRPLRRRATLRSDRRRRPTCTALRQNIAAARAAGTGCSTTRSMRARRSRGGSASSAGPAHSVAPRRRDDRGDRVFVARRRADRRCGSAPVPRTRGDRRRRSAAAQCRERASRDRADDRAAGARTRCARAARAARSRRRRRSARPGTRSRASSIIAGDESIPGDLKRAGTRSRSSAVV